MTPASTVSQPRFPLVLNVWAKRASRRCRRRSTRLPQAPASRGRAILRPRRRVVTAARRAGVAAVCDGGSVIDAGTIAGTAEPAPTGGRADEVACRPPPHGFR